MTHAPSGSEDLGSVVARILTGMATPGLISVYLFGSHAEGRAHRESDVDVAILLARDVHPTPRDRFEERLRVSMGLSAGLGTPRVDVVVLNDAPPQLGRRIVTGGRRLLCQAPEADHTFLRDIQLRAADVEPFLRRARRLKLASVAR